MVTIIKVIKEVIKSLKFTALFSDEIIELKS